jgi:hypothetical protein
VGSGEWGAGSGDFLFQYLKILTAMAKETYYRGSLNCGFFKILGFRFRVCKEEMSIQLG